MKLYTVFAIILAAGIGFFGGLTALVRAKHHGGPIVMSYTSDGYPIHEHPPADVLGNAQQIGRGAYSSPITPCRAAYDAPNGDLQLCWGEVTEGTAGTTYSDPRPIEGQAPPADLMRSHE